MRTIAAEPVLVETAHAKVNLDLLVVGRRPDGYHELDSVVALTDLGDRLSLEHAPALRLTTGGPFAAALGRGDENLVIRAAHALAARLCERRGALIHLDKRLPIAAGLGGGSADAAATFRGLCRLWGVAPAPEMLHELALGLGSDIPACLAGGPVRLRGRGERIEAFPALPALPLVLVNPGRPVATASVFARLLPASFGGARPGPLPHRPSRVDFAAWLAASRNTLEAPAMTLEPSIGDVLEQLRRAPDCLLARMSGSGATCFGLFADREAARAAAARLGQVRPTWWTAACVTLPSPPMPQATAMTSSDTLPVSTRLPRGLALD